MNFSARDSDWAPVKNFFIGIAIALMICIVFWGGIIWVNYMINH